jgi:hypothetical protein
MQLLDKPTCRSPLRKLAAHLQQFELTSQLQGKLLLDVKCR